MPDSTDAFSCWDLDDDHVCDPNEDKNGDNACTMADCSGANGQDGTNGTNGTNSTVVTSDEPAGFRCPNGGVRIETGVDSDADGVLSTAETEDVRYVCNGAPGQDGQNGVNGSNGETVVVGAEWPEPNGPRMALRPCWSSC